MRAVRFLSKLAIAVLVAASSLAYSAPNDFSQAKRLLRQHVYHDQHQSGDGTFYCGCSWEWVGKSGGRIDASSCGFQTAAMQDRAQRIEWEHVMPISAAGQHRQCWRNGGRENCQKTDPVFNRMEADMHNLVPSIGSVNGLRSNIGFGMVAGKSVPLGACTTKIGNGVRAVEPREEVKGQAARITFYMADRYNIRLSDQQQKLLMAWDRTYPASQWEKERDRRIARAMGHHNPFVTGEKQWTRGYKPSGEGVKPVTAYAQQRKQASQPSSNNLASSTTVYGNRRSGVYHLPVGCPGYTQMSPANRVEFGSEAEAIAAGYRKAGNCS